MPGGQLAYWDFTLSVTGRSPQMIIEKLQQLAKKWAFQKEAGDQKGHLHYQVRILLRKKTVWSKLKEHLTALSLEDAYLTASSTESTKGQGVFSYVMKIDTRVEGPWTDKDNQPPAFIGWQYEGCEQTLRPWQKFIWDNVDSRDRRVVNCVVDEAGNRGKSMLSNLMRLHGKAVMIPPVNDFQLLVATTCDILMATENRDPKAIFIDLPRATPKKHLSAMYSAIEQIKSGHVFDMRYHYKSWDFHAAQVWVYTNKYPDTDLLSAGRWKVWNIDKDDQLVEAKKPKAKKPVSSSDED